MIVRSIALCGGVYTGLGEVTKGPGKRIMGSQDAGIGVRCAGTPKTKCT